MGDYWLIVFVSNISLTALALSKRSNKRCLGWLATSGEGEKFYTLDFLQNHSLRYPCSASVRWNVPLKNGPVVFRTCDECLWRLLPLTFHAPVAHYLKNSTPPTGVRLAQKNLLSFLSIINSIKTYTHLITDVIQSSNALSLLDSKKMKCRVYLKLLSSGFMHPC